jgi:succinate dehydrogenase / fumarate reductase cytochrome b subunit
MNNHRLKFLDLRLIRLPLPGLVSILHRVSGALMFLALPFMLWMLQCSLRSIETYTRLVDALHQPASKLFLTAVIWAFLHHFFAGIRFLAIDVGLGVKLGPARATSKAVLLVSLAFALLAGAYLW